MQFNGDQELIGYQQERNYTGLAQLELIVNGDRLWVEWTIPLKQE